MTVAELRPVSFSDSFGPIGWSISLVAVLLLHLAFAYYIFIYHRMAVAAPPPPPKAILIDLAPVAPLLGPKIAPLTQPVPLQPLQQPSIVPPSPPIVPPSTQPAKSDPISAALRDNLGVNAAALWAFADRLAQPEGQFSQFVRSGPFAIAYAPPEQAQS